MALRATLAVGIAYTCVGCGHGSRGDDDPGPPPQVLHVPMQDGTTEPVWIYAAVPDGPGPHPIVVHGHGQGTGNVANCTPDGAPDDGDAATSRQIADDLAARGYLTIAVLYRNRGAGAPAIGELRGRDHYILDARAFLAAARFARDQLGGQARAALIGTSMGSFPATWATAPLPELGDLQDGLELVTSIPAAMLGNHIGNTGRSAYLMTTSDLEARRAAIAFAAFASVSSRLAIAGDRSLTVEDLDATVAAGLTPAGVELFRRTFLDAPDPELAGCAIGAVPVVCSPPCYAATFAQIAAARGLSDITPSDWLRVETIDAIDFWDPPAAVDPGPTTANAMLAAQRELSPAYALEGPLHTRRLFPLTSIGDAVVIDQLAGSNEPADLYIERLRATGVTIPDPIPVVRDSSCGHGDYLDPSRPGCGWSYVLDELAIAFGR